MVASLWRRHSPRKDCSEAVAAMQDTSMLKKIRHSIAAQLKARSGARAMRLRTVKRQRPTKTGRNEMVSLEGTVAQLAVEYWRLLRTLERAVMLAPEESRDRLASRADYAIERFEIILSEQKITIQEFEGLDFEVNLPVSPLNRGDFDGRGPLIVERTIEPAIICDMRVIHTGQVLLARKS